MSLPPRDRPVCAPGQLSQAGCAKNVRLICVGAIAGAHGVRGDFRLKSFTQVPGDIVAYGPLYSDGQAVRYDVMLKNPAKPTVFIATAPQITNREAAEALKGTKLYVPRDLLPSPNEDEFYYEDLIGLKAVLESGTPFGRVRAVHHFGADFMLELASIPGVKGVQMIAFTRAQVPIVDFVAGLVTIVPDPGAFDLEEMKAQETDEQVRRDDEF